MILNLHVITTITLRQVTLHSFAFVSDPLFLGYLASWLNFLFSLSYSLSCYSLLYLDLVPFYL